MKKCQNCGKAISEFSLSCPFCSAKTNPNTKEDMDSIHKNLTYGRSLMPIFISTVCAIVIPALWLYKWPFFFSEIGGPDWQEAIMATGGIVLKRSIVILLLGVVIFAFIRVKCNKKFLKMVITTVVLCILHFICLMIFDPRSEVEDYLFFYVLNFIPYISIGCGAGSSILQCLLILSWDSQESLRNIAYICCIAITYLVVGICGSSTIFLAFDNPFEVMLCTTLAEILATIVMAFILWKIKNKKAKKSTL